MAAVGHTAEVMGLAGSSDNTVFVSGSCDRTAKLWDVRDKVAKQTFTGILSTSKHHS